MPRGGSEKEIKVRITRYCTRNVTCLIRADIFKDMNNTLCSRNDKSCQCRPDLTPKHTKPLIVKVTFIHVGCHDNAKASACISTGNKNVITYLLKSVSQFSWFLHAGQKRSAELLSPASAGSQFGCC